MPFCCERCGKPFRDRYDLNKHSQRKNPCITTTTPQQDTSGVVLINNGTINIQVINNESIDGGVTMSLIETMRETISLGGPEFDEQRALRWITELHNQICKDPTNHNVVLKTVKSTTTRYSRTKGGLPDTPTRLLRNSSKLGHRNLLTLISTNTIHGC